MAAILDTLENNIGRVGDLAVKGVGIYRSVIETPPGRNAPTGSSTAPPAEPVSRPPESPSAPDAIVAKSSIARPGVLMMLLVVVLAVVVARRL